ncbi:MAG: Gfo/Idh/MocA family protein [Candidatus Zipacnadales bacterium]
MAPPYRVAVIGRTGRGDYGHDVDTVWLDLPDVVVVAVADEDPEGRARAQVRLKAREAYDDYRVMLRYEKPDLVSIAPRWLDGHCEMLLACAEAGVKGVLIEKPLCRTLEEADEMIAACERTGMKAAICHQTRYSPRLTVVKQLLESGRIGTLLELRARGKEDQRGGGEDLMVLGTHLMDLMRFLAGDPQWCFARVTEGDVPVTRQHVREGAEGIGPLAGDTITAMYGFGGPTVGYFASHRAQHGATARFGLHIYGTRGQIAVRTGSLPPAFLLEDPSWSPGQSGELWKPITSAGVGVPEPLTDTSLRWGNRLIARDLIDCIVQDREPLGSLRDGRAALEMILAVYESHRVNALVKLPLENRTHPLTRL